MDQDIIGTESSAPALSRGIRIIQCLSKSGPMTLEQLSRDLNIPKASALRFLTTLEQMGIIHRNAEKQYEALYRLQSMQSPIESFRYSLEGKMERLVTTTGCTVEWYEPTSKGMQLISQKNPAVELCVQARPGFIRDWHSEFDAVARIGHTFADQAPNISESHTYCKNGELKSVDRSYIEQAILRIRTEQITYDKAFNTNGVRRFAAAAFDPIMSTFHGALAIAEVYHFAKSTPPETLINHLRKTFQ